MFNVDFLLFGILLVYGDFPNINRIIYLIKKELLVTFVFPNGFNILALFVFLSDDTGSCRSLRELYDEALGIAKLPGFFEWLSIHPIITELDGEETTEASRSCHKMIIFAHHHIVLDGVQVKSLEMHVKIDFTCLFAWTNYTLLFAVSTNSSNFSWFDLLPLLLSLL